MIRASIVSICLILAGCSDAPVWLGPPPEATVPPSAEDGPGRVAGRIRGIGPIPKIDDFHTVFVSADFRPISETRPNPHRPRIDPTSLDISGAWVEAPGGPSVRDDSATLDIRIDDDRIAFADRPVGSVLAVAPIGTRARIRSTGTRFQMLRASGASDFTAPLLRTDSVAERILSQPGLVELSNPAGAWWQRAWIVVGSPRRNSVTDIRGRYELTGLAVGPQEIVVRLPHPGVERRDRNPDVGAIARLWYRPMIEVRRTVDVPATGTATLDITFDLNLFAAP